jgi:hypothetical protein
MLASANFTCLLFDDAERSSNISSQYEPHFQIDRCKDDALIGDHLNTYQPSDSPEPTKDRCGTVSDIMAKMAASPIRITVPP